MITIGYFAFGLVVVAFELLRLKRRNMRVDFLFGMSCAYAFAYGLIPFLLLLNKDSLSFAIDEFVGFTVTQDVLSSALVCAIAGYVAFKGSYLMTMNSRRRVPVSYVDRNPTAVGPIALGLVGVGMACLYVYSNSIGGLTTLFTSGAYFRGNSDAVFEYGVERTAFLRNLALIAITGVIMLTGKKRSLLTQLAILLGIIGSLALLWHRSGRLEALLFITWVLYLPKLASGKIRLGFVAAATGVILLAIVYGKDVFWVFYTPVGFSPEAWDWKDAWNRLILEFTFPIASLATAIKFIPGQTGFRFFIDLPIAAISLVPKRILGIQFPETLGEINTNLMQSQSNIPVDSLGFGYYSLGIAGIVIWMIVLGVASAILDHSTSRYSSNSLSEKLRGVMQLYLPTRILYGDPYHFVQGVSVLGLLGIWIIQTRRERIREGVTTSIPQERSNPVDPSALRTAIVSNPAL